MNTNPALESWMEEAHPDRRPVENVTDYRHLEIAHQGCTRQRPDNFILKSGRESLLAASKRSHEIYIARRDEVYVYDTPTGPGPTEFGNHPKLKVVRHFPNEPHAEGYLDPYDPFAITNMHVGELGGEEVLVVTDDSGHAEVYFTSDFKRTPLTFKLPMSAWGIDTHSDKRLVAISCNAHIVTIFHVGFGLEGWDWTARTPEEGDSHPKIELMQHQENIPCVAFDASGNYLISGGLDYLVCFWDCQTGQFIKKIEDTNTIWAVRFVNKCDFTHCHKGEQDTSRKKEETPDDDTLIASLLTWHSPDNDTTAMVPPGLDFVYRLAQRIHRPRRESNVSEETEQQGTTESTQERFASEVESQLVLYTKGLYLVLLNPVTLERLRQVRLQHWVSYSEFFNFCYLNIVPSLSMIFVASPRRTACIYRMVYLEKDDEYSLIPEQRLVVRSKHDSHNREDKVPYCGAVVQALRIDRERDLSREMGVRLLLLLRDGEASWWTVRRPDDPEVGIEDIVL